MILIDPDANLIIEPNPYKKIELVGRTCYKSEDKITETSCYKFVEGLANRKHFAMLEHSRFTFALSNVVPFWRHLISLPGVAFRDYIKLYDSSGSYVDAALINVSMSHLYNPKWEDLSNLFTTCREIVEKRYKYNDTSVIDRWIKTPIYACDVKLIETELDYTDFQYLTIKFTCDRGVSHELVRHRCAVAQESTRYCNYSKEQFGNQITFIKPANYDEWDNMSKIVYEDCLKVCESSYMDLVTLGNKTPQQARAVLPNSTKTDCILTMSVEQWNHFFSLRSYGDTGAPHPDMKVVADIALQKAKLCNPHIK